MVSSTFRVCHKNSFMALPRSLCSVCVSVSVVCVEIHRDQKRFLRGGDTEPPDVGAAIQYALTLEAI